MDELLLNVLEVATPSQLPRQIRARAVIYKV